MDGPADGWDQDLVRACTFYTGSFYSFVRSLNAIAHGLQWKHADRNVYDHSRDSEECKSERFNADARQQDGQNGHISDQFHVIEPLRLGCDGGPLRMVGSSAPFVLYCAARKLASQRTTWLRAAGLATAASLSAAMAATSAELPSVDPDRDRRDLQDTSGAVPDSGSDEPSQLAKTALNLSAWGRCSQRTWQQIFRNSLSSPGTCLDPILGEDEGELSSACISVTKGVVKGAVVEPKTKVRFPVLICEDGSDGEAAASDSCQVLAGVGVRSKTLIKLKSIKVYAFGIYVRPEKLREVFGEKYGGVPPEELKLRGDFYNDLLSREVGMTVRLVVHYKGLTMEMVRSAFVTSLKNRLRKIKGSEDDEGLNVFSGYFSQPMDISRGTTIDFCWQPGGRLLTHIAGKKMQPIVSPHLCRAFFDLYIGEPPVSEDAKQEIGESFARMLKAC